MLPSPSSSPRAVFDNCTNLPISLAPVNPPKFLPTPPRDKAAKRSAHQDGPLPKRVKLSFDDESSEGSNSDSDAKSENTSTNRRKTQKYSLYGTNSRSIMVPINRYGYFPQPTRPILQSFVSSNKSDVFRCQSTDINTYLTLPYACSYTHGAKQGHLPILAVATEQGSIHLLNTSQRRDWDVEPQRAVIQAHNNGIFDIKWNNDDTLLATCSGDQSTHITCPITTTPLHALRGHTSTVKCVAWDPCHHSLLSSGGRDGNIYIWDIRMAGEQGDDGGPVLSPAISIIGAHEAPKARGRPRKGVPTPRGITNLLYPDADPYGLISSGSFDGILRYWDLRQPTNGRTSKTVKTKAPPVLYSSPIDPTTLHGSRRSRGIIALAGGIGPTAGLVFGLGADSRIHTYTLPSLAAKTTSYMHKNLQGNSFYVGLSMSPCGYWLASGGTGALGSNFLFDVSSATSSLSATRNQMGVELRGQIGEVGALDWAENSLATCADDGTVRVWRPDIERYKSCMEQPDEKRWDWSWTVDDVE
ncbi:WD40-repeat-containing domain protein [Collybia nuda]|uniref:WD40-repeat-containing domain protein n=1 Tax=Collybia nuda TaxID=64659 RepID=A0A9P5YFG5_9AGAR|nr:WD40-repeat-containing domain protein [Collybia nuda]